MAQVTISLNGREYRIACEDGEEEHIDYLAKYINHHVEALVSRVGQVGEARLLLMASLQLADELSEAFSELDEIKSGKAPAEPAAATDGRDTLEMIENVAERLERIAARLENA
jgi:cell division protein ZapA